MIDARIRLPALALCVFVSLAGTTGAGDVRVTIWEGLPSPWDWNAPSGPPDDRYDTPAMGFSRLPAKVNARGIEIDRAAPFAVHAEANLRVPAGSYKLILRAKGSARVTIDGRLAAETDPIQPNAAGHEAVPEVPAPEDARWREIAAGDQERVVAWTSDGKSHAVELWAVLGARKLRPEPGEMSVSIV